MIEEQSPGDLRDNLLVHLLLKERRRIELQGSTNQKYDRKMLAQIAAEAERLSRSARVAYSVAVSEQTIRFDVETPSHLRIP